MRVSKQTRQHPFRVGGFTGEPRSVVRRMRHLLAKIFRWYDAPRLNAAYALVNALTKSKIGTPVQVKHAQVIDPSGDVRLYTTDGGEYVLSFVRVR